MTRNHKHTFSKQLADIMTYNALRVDSNELPVDKR